jgi:hypothetical protein
MHALVLTIRSGLTLKVSIDGSVSQTTPDLNLAWKCNERSDQLLVEVCVNVDQPCSYGLLSSCGSASAKYTTCETTRSWAKKSATSYAKPKRTRIDGKRSTILYASELNLQH